TRLSRLTAEDAFASGPDVAITTCHPLAHEQRIDRCGVQPCEPVVQTIHDSSRPWRKWSDENTKLDRVKRVNTNMEQELMDLVLCAQHGDRDAYGQLVLRFESTVYAVARSRLRNPTEAQELTQEGFLHGM